jgi:hypothetical protein
MWISPAFAQAAATPSAGAADFFVQLVPLFLIIGIMYSWCCARSSSA